MNALPSVDSFFLMGGTVTAYIMFRELDKAGSDLGRHLVTSVLYYVHRYLRLTIPYALIMGVVVAVLPHLAYGPQWNRVVASGQVSKAARLKICTFCLKLGGNLLFHIIIGKV